MPATDNDRLLPFSLPSICKKRVTAAFDGGLISSDGGVLLLAGADRQLGLIDRLAAIIPDHRNPDLITHSMADILRARVFAIACGYPDADDLDDLRKDPAFKLACGRLPESGDDLASQPTMSRWENAPDLRTLIRLMRAMVELWCKSYHRAPKSITLDIDDTADIVHGHQQLSLFNAHYDERCFLPIHVYDADTGHCVLTILRPGKTPDGKEVTGHLRRLVRCIRGHWPHTRITIRGDSHYGRREAMEWCEDNGIHYLFGLSTNTVLAAQVFTKTDEVCVRRAIANLDLVRDYTETRYAAKSWLHPRRVVARIEATRKGLDVRYVVTNITYGAAGWLYDSLYCARGSREPDQAAQEPIGLRPDQLSFAACQSDAIDPAHSCLLADAYGARCHPRAATVGQRRVLHHSAAVTEDRSTDQGNRESDRTGVCRKLSGRHAVPWAGWCADPASDVSGGARAPAEFRLINPQRLTDTV